MSFIRGWFGLWGMKARRALVRSAVGLHARILVWDPYQPGLSNRGVVRMLVETTREFGVQDSILMEFDIMNMIKHNISRI